MTQARQVGNEVAMLAGLRPHGFDVMQEVIDSSPTGPRPAQNEARRDNPGFARAAPAADARTDRVTAPPAAHDPSG
ncbi:MAG: hypothetical protein EKK53_13090 [Burkholderiales bacterium]|nr:MAG: hypothetical protein EKK53_13090 [Burkholderiales bacterium]